MSNQAIRNQRVMRQCQAAYDNAQSPEYYEGPDDDEENAAEEPEE